MLLAVAPLSPDTISLESTRAWLSTAQNMISKYATPATLAWWSGDVIAAPLIKEVFKLCLKRGAYPSVHVGLPGMVETYLKNASDDQLKKFPEVAMFESKKADVFIGIRGTSNTRELSGIDPRKLAIRSKTTNQKNTAPWFS